MNGDVRALFSELGVELRGNGANVAVRCFADAAAHKHADRTKSCSISLSNGAWNCKACGAKGGPYDAALALGRAPAEAMALLERFGFVEGNGVRTQAPFAVDEEQIRAWTAALGDVELARLAELRGWTREAAARLELGFDGDRVTFPVRRGSGRLAGLLRYEPDPARRAGAAKMLSLAGSQRDLFPAPEELEQEDVVLLVEGEPDAVRAWSLGLPAVAMPGVQGWKAAWAERFRRFFEVIVVFDCDSQGRDAAHRVASELAAAGVSSVRILDLAPQRDDGYDLSDFTAKAKTAREREQARTLLLELAAEAPLVTPGPIQVDELVQALVVLTARELCALPDPPASDGLLGPLVVRGQRIVLGAHTGEGKTTLALQIAGAVLRGEEFLDWHGAGDVRGLVIDAEQGLKTVKRRLREAGLDDCEQLDYLRVPDGLALDSNEQDVAELEAVLAAGQHALVFAGPLYKLHRGDSNDERAAIDLMRRFDAWRERYGFALLTEVHLRKPPPQGARLTIHDFFGSSAYQRGAEVVLGLQRVRAGYGRLHFFKDRDGDLPIGERWGLLFDRDEGFRRDPKDTGPSTRERVAELRAADSNLTQEQIAEELGVTARTVRNYWHEEADEAQGSLLDEE